MAERYESATQAAAQKMLPLPGPPGTSSHTSGGELPTGGMIHQVLTKLSSTDFDADWETPSTGGFPLTYDDGTYTYTITAGSGTQLFLEVSKDADPSQNVRFYLEGDNLTASLFTGDVGGLFWDPSGGASLFADAGVTLTSADGTIALTGNALELQGVDVDPTGGSSGDVLTLGAGGTIALAPPSLTSSPPTVTGSRLASPALASLLTALAGLGLIIDSTTT